MFCVMNFTQKMETLRERDEAELQAEIDAEYDAEMEFLKKHQLWSMYHDEKLWDKIAERRISSQKSSSKKNPDAGASA